MVKIPFVSAEIAAPALEVELKHYQWCCVVRPKVSTKLYLTSEGLNVNFCVQESEPLISVTSQQEPPLLTCKDSAVEIFLAFSPFEHDENFQPRLNECLYTNIEVNAAGICYAEYGMQRNLRYTYNLAQIESLKIKTQITANYWTCDFVIPRSLIRGIIGYDGFTETFGLNLYKISETASCEHYVSWQKVKVEKPNFHLPEFFALAQAK